MLHDQHGNPLPGATQEASGLYDQALGAFNLYRGDPVALIDQAIDAAPGFTMAHILKTYLFALATEPEASREARSMLEHAKTLPMDDRAASHATALTHLLAGNWTPAALTLDRHSMSYPHDLLALQCGHLMDFFRGNARDLRDRIARALPAWSKDMPSYSILLGLQAFGLEETGDYERAEDAGRKAVELQPLDCWAHHAVAHVLEMQGRTQDGLNWMKSREPHWAGDDNFFQIHNWWHTALFHLDQADSKMALAYYDSRIRDGKSEVAVDLVDASALLWRLQLDGHDVGNRWQELSTHWDAHADGVLYAFNDWHAVMAYLGAGRTQEVDRILGTYRKNDADLSETNLWARQTGLPLIEGFTMFWQGKYQTAVERLHDARFIANSFGGSHAQRDIIDWTLVEAAIRGGMRDISESLANERLSLKPHSPINKNFLKRANALDTGKTIAA